MEQPPQSTTSTSADSRFITQLQVTTAAVQELHKSIGPFLNILKQRDTTPSNARIPGKGPSHLHNNTATTPEEYRAHNDELRPTSSIQNTPQDIVVAQSVVALTLSTMCYLQPRLVRVSNHNQSTRMKSSTLPLTNTKSKQQTQIRLDLNHIRQLLKTVRAKRSRALSISRDKEHTIKRIKHA
jgi:hypothetical protein